ncbi:hypothetical protein [Actinoplanes sp. L3-i22]|uniref:hypothetical protein n=1 Tax=Actinoplanes sp. L3-i22 TaxID=2836373 RepID=UPI001C73FB60|nr:hypothetical protein [Actinoplanes sp. L3-i22]BCY05087.1 hypothetical protein L3i22_001750 [Actinoplanes sp. L3-i22]
MVDINELLPRERTPRHYRDLAGDPRIDQEGLRTLAVSGFAFVRVAVAENPRADAATLATIPIDDLDVYTRNGLLVILARHRNADRALLLDLLRRAVRLLNEPNQRPYAFVLALAGRAELSRTEVLTLIRQPNSARRMNSAVVRCLDSRDPAAD